MTAGQNRPTRFCQRLLGTLHGPRASCPWWVTLPRPRRTSNPVHHGAWHLLLQISKRSTVSRNLALIHISLLRSVNKLSIGKAPLCLKTCLSPVSEPWPLLRRALRTAWMPSWMQGKQGQQAASLRSKYMVLLPANIRQCLGRDSRTAVAIALRRSASCSGSTRALDQASRRP